MLAGTIVVQRRRRTGSRHCGGRGLRDRPMCAAAQVGRHEPDFRQYPLDAGDMRGFPAMRGASERQFLVAQAKTIGRALLDQWQRLQRLHRGTRKYRRRHVAKSKNTTALRVGHGNGAAVPAFDQRSANHVDQNGIGHAELFTGSKRGCPTAALPAMFPPWVLIWGGSLSSFLYWTKRRSSSRRWRRSRHRRPAAPK